MDTYAHTLIRLSLRSWPDGYEYAQLEALAAARGQTISELIRSVLLEEIATPNGEAVAAAEWQSHGCRDRNPAETTIKLGQRGRN